MTGAVVALSAIALLVVAFWLRTKLAAPVVLVLLVTLSAALGWSAMALRPDPSTGETVLAVLVMAALGPLHTRAVLGRFGPRRRWGSSGR